MEETKKQKIVVCDIDGTISDARQRVKDYLYDGYICSSCGREISKNEYMGEKICYGETGGINVGIRMRNCTGEIVKKEKDYKGFYGAVGEDKPMGMIIDIVSRLMLVDDIKIVFVTGRSEFCRKLTRNWLEEEFGETKFDLIMRANYDRRPSAQVKKAVIRNLLKAEDIAFVLDDEPSVIEMYKKNCPNATIIDVKNYLHDETGS